MSPLQRKINLNKNKKMDSTLFEIYPENHDFEYRYFLDNLSVHLQNDEVQSLNVLGESFFVLVDYIASYIISERSQDSLLLGLNLQDFLWELQVFAHQFIRTNAGASLKVRIYCDALAELLSNPKHEEAFQSEITEIYENYFFINESESQSIM